MCCDLPDSLLAPGPVGAMLEEYRALLAKSSHDWGEEMKGFPLFDFGRVLETDELMAAIGRAGSFPAAVRQCLPDPLRSGVVVVRLRDPEPEVEMGAMPWAIGGSPVELDVVLDSRLDDATEVVIDGVTHRVPGGAVLLITVPVEAEPGEVTIGDQKVKVVEAVPTARLRLRSDAVSRWSVIDDRGGAWFPPARLTKWDFHGRPFFHGAEAELEVPAVPLSVFCGRGVEFEVAQTTVEPAAEMDVELRPRRHYDAAARGFYGGDMHVHMNYSGDLVCDPHEASLMQRGEGLHVMNLVAGNLLSTRVYDREAFEHFAGVDLAWTDESLVARWGVEYRNDLLGHFHALSPSGPPVRYHTGHAGSDEPHDWPPNSAACEELRGLGATVGYTHPVFSALSDGTPADAFTRPRSVEARELVADAALGLVDSMDLLGPNHVEGTAALYHHLLSCGLRLAATVGSDVFLSYSRGGVFANPPGWARAYADLQGAPVSVAAYQEAVRARRTFATNGPWLELSVNGRGLGEVVAARPAEVVTVTAAFAGTGVEELTIEGPEGVIASGPGPQLTTEVRVDRSVWLAAVARGPIHPDVLGPTVFAHTSPVWVEVDGQPVARPESAAWCLDWLDRTEALVRTHGQFGDDGQRDEVIEVLARARLFYEAIAAS